LRRLASRLNRLEREIASAGEPCVEGRPVVLLWHWDGEPKPVVPIDAPRCVLCGEVHAIIVRLVYVLGPTTGGSDGQ
jgi:hypothetical protein